uniref:Uncharacterized protein n=1 Tax=Vespula pensylvanica TaxID=30213 RepID=A0A834UA46_VESPE|nr:hypothetical protein H0235_007744 [Vespula pensylvanica]
MRVFSRHAIRHTISFSEHCCYARGISRVVNYPTIVLLQLRWSSWIKTNIIPTRSFSNNAVMQRQKRRINGEHNPKCSSSSSSSSSLSSSSRRSSDITKNHGAAFRPDIFQLPVNMIGGGRCCKSAPRRCSHT